MKKNPTPFNVIVHGLNCKGVKAHDIMPYLIECYKETKKSKKAWKKTPETFEEFKKFVIDESRYMYWARCEWEIIVQDWPCRKVEDKIDVFWQIEMNINLVTRLLMENVGIK